MTGQDLIDADPISNDTAKKRAKKLLRHKNKKALRSHFKLPGNVAVVSGQTLTTQGFGLFDVKWFIEEAQHVVVGGKYETEIDMRIVLSY